MYPPVPVVPPVPHAPAAFYGGAVRRGYAVGGCGRGRGGVPIRGGGRAGVGPHGARRPVVRSRRSAVHAAPAVAAVNKMLEILFLHLHLDFHLESTSPDRSSGAR